MGTIQKREQDSGKTSYRALVRLKGFPAQSATFPNKTLATRWIQKTEADLRAGRYFGEVPGQRITLDEVIERYRSEILPDLDSGESREAHLKFWSEKLGYRTLAEIKTAEIVRFRDSLRSGKLTNGTINRYIATLRHMLNIAKRRWGLIERNPAADVESLREPKGRERFLSDDERTQLLDVCNTISQDLYVAVVLALTTGARKTEIWSLAWLQVDLDEDRITFFETKNDSTRSVPLIEPAKSLLVEHKQIRDRLPEEERSPFIFPAKRDQNESYDFTYQWRRALKSSGIQDFRWHDLRHTAASYLAAAGVSDLVIAQVLGHKNLQMVKRYAHLRTQDLKEHLTLLGKRIGS